MPSSTSSTVDTPVTASYAPSVAPLAVAVEIHAGPRRAFRLSDEVGERAILVGRDLPFEAGRPVTATFALPDDLPSVEIDGVVTGPREITYTRIAGADRARIARYVLERNTAP
jgi:hypothetical protein